MHTFSRLPTGKGKVILWRNRSISLKTYLQWLSSEFWLGRFQNIGRKLKEDPAVLSEWFFAWILSWKNYLELYSFLSVVPILVIPLFQYIVVRKGFKSQLHHFLAAGMFRQWKWRAHMPWTQNWGKSYLP